MFCAAIQEFASSLLADAGLLRASVSAGEPIDQTEVLSLAAMAQSLFVTVTVESRKFDRVNACHQLWTEAAKLFSELCDSWAGIESDDPQVKWLRGRLTHFAELCRDRTSLYAISERERSEYQERRSIEVETSFGEREFL
jgi:hypothetical protein